MYLTYQDKQRIANGVSFIQMVMAFGTDLEFGYSSQDEYEIQRAHELGIAIENRDYGAMREYLSGWNRVNPNSRYNLGTLLFPLYQAVMQDDLTAVQILVNAGANVNQQQANGEFALAIAANRGDAQIVEYLLQNGANPNLRTGSMVALSFASTAEVVNILLRYGADPNMPDSDGDAPIVEQVCSGRWDVVEALIKGGTNLRTRNYSGKSFVDFWNSYSGYKPWNITALIRQYS